MLGLSGGAAGTGFAGPANSGVINPTDAGQISGAYNNVQDSMASQRALLSALQAQNGLGNQTQVYNQLQGVANGTGPNPAQAMLAQSTGANVANQAALMAGQRGASANSGLIARQAAQQGASTQQQAAGQAASLQAQQSLNAINSAGGIANTQASNQIGQTNANTQAQQAEQQALLNAQAQVNNANVGMQSNMNNVNGQLANTTMQGQQKMVGGLMNSIGGFSGFADGGEVPDTSTPTFSSSSSDGDKGGGLSAIMKVLPLLALADGGEASAFQGPQSKFGQFLTSQASVNSFDTATPTFSAAMPSSPKKDKPEDKTKPTEDENGIGGNGYLAEGGKVPAMLSPGEKYLKPNEAMAVAKGKESPADVGKIIPGKPKYKGNNYANDVVPAELDEGGVVIPNKVMQSKDPVNGAAKFVQAVLAKKRMKK